MIRPRPIVGTPVIQMLPDAAASQFPANPLSRDRLPAKCALEEAAGECMFRISRPSILATQNILADVEKMAVHQPLVPSLEDLAVAMELADIEPVNDGNTPLHVAAFLCHAELVKLLLNKSVSPLTKSNRGETQIDVVSSAWDQTLADFYAGLGKSVGLELDLERTKRDRPKIAEFLRNHGKSDK